jgi:hypothetical protein
MSDIGARTSQALRIAAALLLLAPTAAWCPEFSAVGPIEPSELAGCWALTLGAWGPESYSPGVLAPLTPPMRLRLSLDPIREKGGAQSFEVLPMAEALETRTEYKLGSWKPTGSSEITVLWGRGKGWTTITLKGTPNELRGELRTFSDDLDSNPRMPRTSAAMVRMACSEPKPNEQPR